MRTMTRESFDTEISKLTPMIHIGYINAQMHVIKILEAQLDIDRATKNTAAISSLIIVMVKMMDMKIEIKYIVDSIISSLEAADCFTKEEANNGE